MGNLLAVGVPLPVILVGVGALALLIPIGIALYLSAFGPRARLRKRIAAVLGNGGTVRMKGKNTALTKKKQIQGKLKAIEAKRAKEWGQYFKEKLAQANLSLSLLQFFGGGIAIGAAATGLYFLAGLPRIGLPLVFIIVGIGLPQFALNFLIKRRLKAFGKTFADAIDVIVRGIRSGLPVGECIAMIGREMPEPVALEFRLLSEAQKLGIPLDEALIKATVRIPTAELRFFSIVLAIQQQTGGNLAETLSKLSDVLRQRKKMRDKAAAMASEAKASAVIIGALPVAVIGLLFVVSPDYISLLFTTDTGHNILGIAALIMGVGMFIMRQMINFDI